MSAAYAFGVYLAMPILCVKVATLFLQLDLTRRLGNLGLTF